MRKTYPKIGRFLREKFNYTQIDLRALLLNAFSLSSIRNYEHGERDAPASYLLALAELYQCTFPYLFDNPLDFHMYASIDTQLYSYVNHVSQFTHPEKNIGYRFDANIDIQKHQYRYFMILDDDTTLNLPRLSRLLVQMKVKEKIDVTEKEQIFLITVSKETHPDYGYNYLEIDNKDPELVSQRSGSKQFLTRARIITDIKNVKYVMYYDNTTIRHSAYRDFIDMIDGIVTKIVFDENMIIR